MCFSGWCFLFIWWNIFVFQFQINLVSAVPVVELQTTNHLDYPHLLRKGTFKEVWDIDQQEYPDFSQHLVARTINKTQPLKPRVPQKFSTHLRGKRYTLKDFKWTKTEIYYSFDYNHESFDPLYQPSFTVQRAFRAWQQYIPLRFHPTTDKKKADILLFFKTMDGPGGDGAEATLSENEETYEICFDKDEDWNFHDKDGHSNSNGIMCFLQVAIHEIGHALGLAHSEDENSVMYWSYIGSKVRIDDLLMYKLPMDDVIGIQQHYNFLNEEQINYV